MNVIIPDSDEDDIFSAESDADISISSVSGQVSSLEYQHSSTTEHNPSDDEFYIPPDVVQSAQAAEACLIPPASKLIYDRAYDRFQSFLADKKIRMINEVVLMGYFHGLSRPPHSMAPKSLWSIFSMLKTTLSVYNKIDIAQYSKLARFLSGNQKRSEHVVKKAKTLTDANMAKFIYTAPDSIYLPEKVNIN